MQMQKIIPHADLAFVPQGNKLGISAKITSEKQTNKPRNPTETLAYTTILSCKHIYSVFLVSIQKCN